MKRVSPLVLILVGTFLWGSGMVMEHDSLALCLDFQRYQFPQEKIHVKTDKSQYMGGDTIWFRAFVVDACTHEPLKLSKYVYAELKTPFDSLLCRVMIKEVEGVYAGYMAIPPKVAEGDYTLTAYTLFMEGVGEQYFFKKSLPILSPFATQTVINPQFDWDNEKKEFKVEVSYKDKITGADKSYKEMTYSTRDGKSRIKRLGNKSVTFTLKNEDLDAGYVYVSFNNYKKYLRLPASPQNYAVTFHPEGGYLVAESPCKVAFKSINNTGLGETIKGSVVNSLGNEVTKFETLHAGMGMFSFIPRAGMRYQANCYNNSGEKIVVPLPDVAANATVLKVSYPNKATFAISLLNDKKKVNDKYHLVIQQRGKLLHSSEFNSSKDVLSFKKSDFPSGILQILLLDSEWNTLSERMLFVDNIENGSVACKSNQSNYGNREKVVLEVDLKDFITPQCNFAVSVTDNSSIAPDTLNSIGVTLLLNSELRGHIENPSYYFSLSSSDAHQDVALDALMLTQGWRRYDIPSVLKGDYDSPSSVVEIGQEISGEVCSTWSNKPLRGASINILSPKVGFYNIVKSDSAGRFCFNGFDYPEGTKFVLQAFTAKNKEIMNLRVDELVFPNTSAIIGVTADAENKKEINEFLERELKRSQYDADLRSILLDELTVLGRKIKQSEDVFENLATKTFNYEEFEKMKITSVEEVLRKIPNIRINNGIITYRGNAIALYIDRIYQETMIEMIDMPMPSVSTQNNFGVRFIDIDIIPFDMIKRIDFLRPNEAVVLGTKATGGGALMITTKRGDEGYKWTKPTDIVNITPLGYQRPAEFYSPRYEINEPSIGDDTRTTIYWNPNIKTDESGNSKIEFFTNDIRNTTYTIIIEGITPAGEIISEKYPLKIK